MRQTEEKTPLGSVHISPKAIATIAYHALHQTYGVVGLAPKNRLQALTRDPLQGIEVRYDGEGLEIEVYILVEYGTNLRAVANSAANQVRYAVEKALGLPIKSVNVHIRGLRHSKSQEAASEEEA